MKTIFAQFLRVLLVIISICIGVLAGSIIGLDLGGNFRCFAFINKLTGGASGYESCGIFGFFVGLALGIAGGVFVWVKTRKPKP